MDGLADIKSREIVHVPFHQKKILGIRLSAIAEMLIFFSVLLFYDYFFDNRIRFLDVYPHPFWVIVLLISVQYGTIEGIIAAVLSTVFLYVGNLPVQKTTESLFDYQFRLILLPVLWFVTAFILGELRMRVEREKRILKEERDQAELKATAITDAYQQLKEVKEGLETRIASQLKTSSVIYKAFKYLGDLNPAFILLNLEQVVKPIMNPKKFSVYSLGANGFEPAINYGWEENEKYIRRFPPTDALYQEIVGKQRIICIVNSEDEKILKGEGLVAAPLIDSESGEIFGMLKIEQMDFIDLNISNLESFKTLCELIGIAYANARQHKHIQQNLITTEQSDIFSYQLYKIQSQYLMELAKKAHFPLIVISIKQERVSAFYEAALLRLLLHEKLPEPFQIFQSGRIRGEILILLPFLHLQEGKHLVDKVLASANENDVLKENRLICSVQLLVDAQQ